MHPGLLEDPTLQGLQVAISREAGPRGLSPYAEVICSCLPRYKIRLEPLKAVVHALRKFHLYMCCPGAVSRVSSFHGTVHDPAMQPPAMSRKSTRQLQDMT